MKKSVANAVAALIVLLWGGASLAAPTAEQQALAERLFREAKTNMDQGQHAVACPQLEESMRLDPGGGTQLTLALCYEGAGRTASAWGAFLEAAAQARRDGRADRETIATDRATALESQLINLTIRVPAEVAQLTGFVLTRDGAPVAPASFSVATPVDPGTVVLRAEAEGYEPWEETVTLSPESKTPEVVVPELITKPASVVATVPGPEPVPAPEPAPASVAPEPAPVAQSAGLSQSSWGYIVGGVGVLSLGVGTVFGLRAVNKAGTVNQACPERQCDERFRADYEAWETSSTVADVAGAIGLLGIGVGSYLILSADDAEALSVSASPLQSGAFFELRRSF
jgi:serine/threonine-protein kinase